MSMYQRWRGAVTACGADADAGADTPIEDRDVILSCQSSLRVADNALLPSAKHCQQLAEALSPTNVESRGYRDTAFVGCPANCRAPTLERYDRR